MVQSTPKGRVWLRASQSHRSRLARGSRFPVIVFTRRHLPQVGIAATIHRMETSASLLERLQGPDPTAWRRFVDLYTPMLFAFARRLGCDEADAADLVQEVFLILMEKLPHFRYDAGKSFRAWLWTVCATRRRQRADPLARCPVDRFSRGGATGPSLGRRIPETFGCPARDDHAARFRARDLESVLGTHRLRVDPQRKWPTTLA